MHAMPVSVEDKSWLFSFRIPMSSSPVPHPLPVFCEDLYVIIPHRWRKEGLASETVSGKRWGTQLVERALVSAFARPVRAS